MKRRMVIIGNIPAAVFIIVFAIGAAAAEPGDKMKARRYADSISLVHDNPEQAYRRASGWAGEAGGHPARYCAAAAMIGMGHAAEAAQRLEDLEGDRRS